MTSNSYSQISLNDLAAYREVFSQSPIRASDYSFSNLWGWAPYYRLEWRFDGLLFWIRQQLYGEVLYWAPVGAWDKVDDWTVYPEISPGNRFVRVPEQLNQIWQQAMPDKLLVEESRGDWDYVYLVSDLATLSGNKFHKKKNLVHQFQRLYNYEFQLLEAACVEEVLDMQVEWCRWRDCESSATLLAENDAVARVLANWEAIGDLQGGIIRVDGKPCAYTLAEQLTEDTVVIHFEKAASEMKGSYQAINYLFAQSLVGRYQYINREQDLDDPGLRKAKLSYNPVELVQKYSVVIL